MDGTLPRKKSTQSSSSNNTANLNLLYLSVINSIKVKLTNLGVLETLSFLFKKATLMDQKMKTVLSSIPNATMTVKK